MIGLMRSENRPSLGRVLVGLGVALALLMAAIWTGLDTGRLPTIELETPRGRIVVELADTAATRSTGLSDHDALSGIDGMLLTWDAPGTHPIWMAGMRFPLDLLWVGRRWTRPIGSSKRAAVSRRPVHDLRATRHRSLRRRT